MRTTLPPRPRSKPTRSLSASLSAAFVVLSAGCGERPTEVGRPLVYDSAGVERIHHAAAPPPALGTREAMRIGSLDGDPATLFEYVTAVGVTGAGEVVITDGGAAEVRIFSPEGAHLRTFGGRGGGPGEAQQFLDARVVGDTVAVLGFAGGPQRWMFFDRDGTVLGAWPAQVTDPEPMRITLQARSGGSWYGVTPVFPDPRSLPPGADLRTGLKGVAVDAATGRARALPVEVPGPVYRLSGGGEASPPRAFEPNPVLIARADGHLLHAPGSAWIVDEYGPDGALLRRATRALETRRVDESLREAFASAVRAGFREQGAADAADRLIEARTPDLGAPLSPVQTMLVGVDGSIWLRVRDLTASDAALVQPEVARSLPGSGEPPPSTWEVLHDLDTLAGRVVLDARFTPLRVARDHVWGVLRDDLDVQYVVRLDLTTPDGGPGAR